ncbi:MAG: cell division topological specificity factor MinE [Legionellales bacterium]|jgi:cell division topological specificity factor|nr:cell division topological specificity factor MinE [Legionellales bacterium]NDH66589.1 cell division topological specificity factor MinE [Gammaproteobacteria bacterium]
MSIFKYLRKKKTSTASVAKERLQIIISHERSERNTPDCLPKLTDLPQMQEEILNVIAKYIPIDREKVSVNLERLGDSAILELNFSMSDKQPELEKELAD